VVTGGEGRFVLEGLDPELLFQLLAYAPGFTPGASEGYEDPRLGPVLLELPASDLASRDPAQVLRCRVVDGKGRPVARAVFAPMGGEQDGHQVYGGTEGVDALAISGADGMLTLGVEHDGQAVLGQVEAPALAPRTSGWLAAGSAEPHVIVLDRGVTVTGRIEKDGEPLAGVTLGLMQVNRNPDHWVGERRIASDAGGRFTLVNVPANEQHFVYGHMDSLRGRGALPVRKERTGAVESTLDLGVLQVERGHTLAGFVVLSTGTPVPEGTRALLAREDAWDTQVGAVGADGSFRFEDLPSELFSLSVRIPGFEPSARNLSYEALNRRLKGRVDEDIEELLLLLEPAGGGGPNLDAGSSQRYVELMQLPLRGAPPEALPGGVALPAGQGGR